MNKVRVRFYITVDLDRAVDKIRGMGKRFLDNPEIEFMDFEDKNQTYAYIVKLGVIKFWEIAGVKQLKK